MKGIQGLEHSRGGNPLPGSNPFLGHGKQERERQLHEVPGASTQPEVVHLSCQRKGFYTCFHLSFISKISFNSFYAIPANAPLCPTPNTGGSIILPKG